MPDARPANAHALCLKSWHCPQMPLPDFERCGIAPARPPFFLPVPTLPTLHMIKIQTEVDQDQ